MSYKHTTKTVLAVAAIALALPHQASVAYGRNHTSKAFSFSAVYNPRIPKSMEFCGKRVDLDREDMFERFDRELTSMAYGHGNTLLTIKRANKYFPTIIPILKANGVPEDLAYLACVESWLSPRAYSPAKAAGIWQFTPGAAKDYGLEVSDEVDERYDLAKSTAAAARFLKRAYGKYGDWPTAMASYNAGQGRISSELEKQLVDSSFDLYLNEETSRYVFRVMAMKALMENPRQFGFEISPEALYQPAECTEVTVSGPVESWPQWAKDHGITFAQLREENPWIRAKQLTNAKGKIYTVRVPKEQSLKRSTQKKRIYNHKWVLQ